LSSEQYVVQQLVGCQVVTEAGEVLGELKDVIPSGGNDIFVVQGKKEILIPALKTVIKQIDLPNRKIIVAPPPGLLEIYEI